MGRKYLARRFLYWFMRYDDLASASHDLATTFLNRRGNALSCSDSSVVEEKFVVSVVLVDSICCESMEKTCL